MAKLTTAQKGISQKPLSHRFFNYSLLKKATLLKAILFSLIAVALIVPISMSIQKSLDFTPYPGAVSITGTVVEVSNDLKEYPKFKPYEGYEKHTFVVPKVKYTYEDSSFLINADEPAPADFVTPDKNSDGSVIEKPVKLLIDAEDPSIAIVDEYKPAFDWVFLSVMSALTLLASTIAFLMWNGLAKARNKRNAQAAKQPKKK